MKTQEVQFGGNNYPCRVVESNEGEELLIGSITLLDALQPGSFNDENEGFASKEAERIYDEVFFFTDMANLRLTDILNKALKFHQGFCLQLSDLTAYNLKKQ